MHKENYPIAFLL